MKFPVFFVIAALDAPTTCETGFKETIHKKISGCKSE
ncbi:unnamed protein product [Brassica oleracea]